VQKSQSLSHYALLMIIVGLVFFGMNKYFKRGIQGKIAGLSDAMIAPRAEHLAFTDADMEYKARSTQELDSEITLQGAGAQRTVSRMDATSSSETETTDEDYVPGSSEGLEDSGSNPDTLDPIPDAPNKPIPDAPNKPISDAPNNPFPRLR
jgi:hypothetical protein